MSVLRRKLERKLVKRLRKIIARRIKAGLPPLPFRESQESKNEAASEASGQGCTTNFTAEPPSTTHEPLL